MTSGGKPIMAAEEEAASDENDPEWASIMSGYFPEADLEP